MTTNDLIARLKRRMREINPYEAEHYADAIRELETLKRERDEAVAELGAAQTGEAMYQAMLKQAHARGFDSVIEAISAATSR